MTLRIRQYEPADREAVWELSRLVLAACGFDRDKLGWDSDLNHIDDAYLDRGGDFLLGTVDGKLVAMGGLKQSSPGDGEITRMRVHPDYQRRGYGQAIMTALEERAVEMGCETLNLETMETQSPAHALYEKNGFLLVQQREVTGFYSRSYQKRLSLRSNTM